MTPTSLIQHNFSLRGLNTFGLECSALAYAQISSVETLRAVIRDIALAALPRFILGGGSNIVLTKDFPGLILHMCNTGITITGEDADATYVCAAAGENWHGFVQWTLAHDLPGLENLSLIPGNVGAAPIQNIGAYGAEVKDFIHSVSALDMASGEIVILTNAECEFAYRDSVFKHRLRDRVIILDVHFALPKVWKPNSRYADVAQELTAGTLTAPNAREISDAIIAIRMRKLPDVKVIGNAGSFFKNPVVIASQRDSLLALHPQLVSYLQPDGRYKLAAGWLIDQCGWKGKRLGQAGVYDKQALVLINCGGASGEEILALAQAIQADVKTRFGVLLEPEPVFV